LNILRLSLNILQKTIIFLSSRLCLWSSIPTPRQQSTNPLWLNAYFRTVTIFGIICFKAPYHSYLWKIFCNLKKFGRFVLKACCFHRRLVNIHPFWADWSLLTSITLNSPHLVQFQLGSMTLGVPLRKLQASIYTQLSLLAIIKLTSLKTRSGWWWVSCVWEIYKCWKAASRFLQYRGLQYCYQTFRKNSIGIYRN